MDKKIPVVCPENEDLAAFMREKSQELVEGRAYENVEMTLYKAYASVCNSKTHIRTLKDLSLVKGVGNWILRQMQGFFETDLSTSQQEGSTISGKNTKGTKRYIPQKNSAAYALLVTLYRVIVNGSDHMLKQELIDAAEASGLSRKPIMPEKGKGKPGKFGTSPRDWYSGWSCMKTLVTKGLVVKSSSRPAKYMLTPEGREIARECLLRSGLADLTDNLTTAGVSNQEESNILDLEVPHTRFLKDVATPSIVLSQKESVEVPPEFLRMFIPMGYSKEQIFQAFSEVSKASPNKPLSSFWPAVLCRLKEDEVYGLALESQKIPREDHIASSVTYKSRQGHEDLVNCGNNQLDNAHTGELLKRNASFSADYSQTSFSLRACSSSDYAGDSQGSDGVGSHMNILSVPPLGYGERFEEAYEVILILDDREHFASQGSRSRKFIENTRSEFKIQIEVRRLPVGDGIWIARHKQLGSEYVLDFIVERKNIDDLRCSIRDNRYRDQKLRLLRCGLKKLIYLVEGDPNSSEAAESIKTACFTTEILEGFDVHRTTGLADTLKKYGRLTKAIAQYYRLQMPEAKQKSSVVCPPFHEFIKRCQELDKLTVTDVFAIQLMQVPQVTEEIATAVLDLYPTIVSLFRAYSLLEGNVSAQEEMLKKQSNDAVSGPASRNIFQLIWGDGGGD